jgi:uncharacterized protein (DUF433 family)
LGYAGVQMMVTSLANVITADPAVRDGLPMISGRRVAVIDVARLHLHDGLSPDEIARELSLDMWQVHAALAHYFRFRAEHDTLVRASADTADRLLSDADARNIAEL